MSKVEKLIELIKPHKILYDLTHEDYKNVWKKDKIWAKIGLELDETVDEVKKKWKNLRDTYSKRVKSAKTHTGQAAHKTWIWSKHMESFRPFLSFTKSSSNITGALTLSEDVVSQSQTETAQCLPENSSIQELTTTAHKRAKTLASESPTSLATAFIKYLDNNQNNAHDEIDILFLLHSQTVKKFSPKRQAITKFKIAEIIMQQEILNLEENNISTAANSHISYDNNLLDPLSTEDCNSSSAPSAYNQTCQTLFSKIFKSEEQEFI